MTHRQAQLRSLAGGFLFLAAWTTAGAQTCASAPPDPPLMATRLYTGSDGQSHIDQVPIMFQSAGAEESALRPLTDGYVVRARPGYFETWHNADRKRYIVVLSGKAEVVTTGGEKVGIVPGHIYIAEDRTGKGHTFRVVGKQEWVALFVNFK